MTDVALDPTPAMARTACSTARTTSSTTPRSRCWCARRWPGRRGVDIVAPSDMMDGRIGAIRQALEANGRAHPDHGLQRQVRQRLLRPVPRCGRLGRQPRQGRQEGLPDGPGQHRRGAARGRARPGRGRRHGDGQARHALSRHRAPRQGRVQGADLRLPGQRRVRDAQGGGAERLARSRCRHDGEPAAFKRAGADGVDLFRARRRPTAAPAG